MFTTLTRRAQPLIRYRTRDLCSVSTSTASADARCARMTKPVGRTDDMLIIRGVNVFPSQIEEVLMTIPEIEPHYQIVVDRKGHLDMVEVWIEVCEDIFPETMGGLERFERGVAKRIYEVLGIQVKVRLKEPKTIAAQRGQGRARRRQAEADVGPVILTQRLELRPFRADDLEALLVVLGDPEVMRYVGTRREPLTRDEVRDALGRAAAHWKAHGFGPLAVVELAGDALVGDAGLQLLEAGTDVELTYTLARGVWGRGYATEAAVAVVEWGFAELTLDRVVAVADPGNAASHRVLEKAGFLRTGVRHCYGADLVEFGIDRTAYAGRASGSLRRTGDDGGPV